MWLLDIRLFSVVGRAVRISLLVIPLSLFLGRLGDNTQTSLIDSDLDKSNTDLFMTRPKTKTKFNLPPLLLDLPRCDRITPNLTSPVG
jgi:hypothetical protein